MDDYERYSEVSKAVGETNALDAVLAFAFSWKMAAILFALFILPTVFYVVRGKTAAILETLGKPHKEAALPGLHFKFPWPITQVVDRVNLQQQEISADVSVKTKDNSFMTLPVKVQYRASSEPEGAVKAHYELANPEGQIKSYVLNNVRQTASGMEMNELYQNRDRVEQDVQTALEERFVRLGYVIVNVLVDEPQPSQEVRDAFNKVIASLRAKEAATNEAEAERIRRVGNATAEAQSKKLQGEGIRQMREEVAKGAAEATEALRQAMPQLTDREIADFLLGITRLDTMTSVGEHGNLVLMDLGSGAPVSGVATAFAGTKAALRTVNSGAVEKSG